MTHGALFTPLTAEEQSTRVAHHYAAPIQGVAPQDYARPWAAIRHLKGDVGSHFGPGPIGVQGRQLAM